MLRELASTSMEPTATQYGMLNQLLAPLLDPPVDSSDALSQTSDYFLGLPCIRMFM